MRPFHDRDLPVWRFARAKAPAVRTLLNPDMAGNAAAAAAAACAVPSKQPEVHGVSVGPSISGVLDVKGLGLQPAEGFGGHRRGAQHARRAGVCSLCSTLPCVGMGHNHVRGVAQARLLCAAKMRAPGLWYALLTTGPPPHTGLPAAIVTHAPEAACSPRRASLSLLV